METHGRRLPLSRSGSPASWAAARNRRSSGYGPSTCISRSCSSARSRRRKHRPSSTRWARTSTRRSRFRLCSRALECFRHVARRACCGWDSRPEQPKRSSLRRRVAERLSPTGVTIEERAFHPHVTLARWRETRHADRRRIAAADRGAEVARVDVGAVTLYQSRLSSSGPTYTMLARAPLAGCST